MTYSLNTFSLQPFLLKEEKMNRLVILFPILLALVLPIRAKSAGTSGSIILRFPVGARAIGMAEAFTGLANDVSSIYWNPSGLCNLNRREFMASYLEGVMDIHHSFLGYAQKTGWGCMGGGISILQAGEATIYHLDGTTRDVTAGQDYVISLALARPVHKELSLGASLKLLSSKLAEEESATSFCIDLGTFYQTKIKDLTLGFSLLNLGAGMKFKEEADPLPLTARLGAAYRYRINPENGLILATDVVKINNNDPRLNIAGEYSYKNTFHGRLGYKIGPDSEGISSGIGFAYRQYRLDYSYSPIEDLESAHRLSVIYGF